jgi:hypothetical protein
MSKLKHIVLFKFKEGITEEVLQPYFDQLLDLTENIEGIEDYVFGKNISLENLDHGYTHGFVMTFADSSVRETYLKSSELQRIRAEVDPKTDSAVVFDFEL